MSGTSLKTVVTNNGQLPIVGACEGGNVYVTTGTKTLTVPAGTEIMVIEALTGTVWFKPGSTGSLPSPYPPVADVTDDTATWRKVSEGQVVDVAVAAGDQFQLEIPASAAASVHWY